MANKKGFKYPRLSILLIIIVLTYIVFSSQELSFGQSLKSSGLIGAFISGILYAFSFTAFTATAVLLKIGHSQNILIAGIVAGAGSVIGDYIILKTARISFSKEFAFLYNEPILRQIVKPIPKPIQHITKIILAIIIIASPLPDEAGVTLLANGYVVPKKIFIPLSFALNTVGILSILYIGSIYNK